MNMQRRGVQQQKTAFKFVDMSSEGQSGDESDKENVQSSYASRLRPSQITNLCKPCTNQDNSKLRSVCTNNKTTPLKDLQFSTLSLEDPSLDYDHLKNANSEKTHLLRENQDLKTLNRELKRQIDALMSTSGDHERKARECEQRFEKYQGELGELRRNNKKLHMEFAKMQKEYENKLLNFELPGTKSWLEETQKIHLETKDRIKAAAEKHLKELAKQKMTPALEQTITDFINELLQISNHPRNGTLTDTTTNKFRSRGSNFTAYRSNRMAEAYRAEKSDLPPIGEDYRMLSKSIQKLKNMEKDIDESCGGYLRKKVEEESSLLNRSVGLDQSVVGGLERSKSRRKRIFQ